MKTALFSSFRGYEIASLPHDIVAGIVVAALTIPIAMGYAQVAGLPPIYGLYASILPAAVYALVTSSHRMVFSMDSAASAAMGGVVAAAGISFSSPEAVRFVPVVTLIAACFLLVFAFVRAGRLMSYVPTPVMHGFIAGISLTVVIEQIPLLIGAQVAFGSDFVANLAAVGASFSSFNAPSCALSLAALTMLFVLKKVAPKVPAALIVLALGLAVTAALRLDTQGVAVLGEISGGLPGLTLPDFTGIDVLPLLGYGLTIATVVAVESLLALDTFSMRDGHRAHENRELVSFGIANAVSALAGCPPCSASVSRTAALDAAQGRSQVAALVSAATIALVVAVLAPFLRYLPQPVLGAIVVVVLIEVVDFKKIARYARHMHVELLVFAVAALAVMMFGAVAGVLFGVALSFASLAYRKHRLTQLGFLGVVPNEKGFELLEDSPDVKPKPDAVICRLGGDLSFANVNAHIDEIARKVGASTKTIIVDITRVSGLDTTATDRLLQALGMAKAHGIKVRLVRSVGLTRDGYTRFEIEQLMKKTKIYPSIEAALEKIPQEDEDVIEETLAGGVR